MGLIEEYFKCLIKAQIKLNLNHISKLKNDLNLIFNNF